LSCVNKNQPKCNSLSGTKDDFVFCGDALHTEVIVQDQEVFWKKLLHGTKIGRIKFSKLITENKTFKLYRGLLHRKMELKMKWIRQ
jgi:hypothetical protein